MKLKEITEKQAKPDFLDIDNDGNKKEPMKQASKDAKKDNGDKKKKDLSKVPPQLRAPVSYTHLTLPTKAHV